MKKQLLLLAGCIASFTGIAQNAAPNGNFENWTSATFDYPQGYTENSNPESYFQCNAPFNATKTTDSYSGLFALKLETTSSAMDTCFGYIANPENSGTGDPSTWTGGFPMTQTPTGLRGYYKYNIASGDSAGILVIARAGGSAIGMYLIPLGGVHSSYTLFNYTFSPALPVTPDSIILAFVSSNPMASSSSVMPGAIAFFDSISFTGITSQPATMNGDFELWSSTTLETPNSWFSGSDRGQGIAKTTDNYAGNFAVEVQTTLGDNNGIPRANSGSVGTGYWDNNCMCQLGGYPFTNQVDTLSFYYKYAPANPADSGYVYLSFKAGGSNIWMAGTYLLAAPGYQLKEVPFNIPVTPDSVIIQFQSSTWGDTALSFIGATLKVDEVHFKTQPLMTGVNAMFLDNKVSFYPNPFRTTGTIMIDGAINTTGMVVNLYDVTGKVVKTVRSNEHKIYIDRTELQNGVYFYELITNNDGIKKGKVVIE